MSLTSKSLAGGVKSTIPSASQNIVVTVKDAEAIKALHANLTKELAVSEERESSVNSQLQAALDAAEEAFGTRDPNEIRRMLAEDKKEVAESAGNADVAADNLRNVFLAAPESFQTRTPAIPQALAAWDSLSTSLKAA
jgi:hypothetical protein